MDGQSENIVPPDPFYNSPGIENRGHSLRSEARGSKDGNAVILDRGLFTEQGFSMKRYGIVRLSPSVVTAWARGS